MTECPVIIRLKSFPAQFASLLIPLLFMAGPGQFQHEQTALLYLGVEVSGLEGSETKCEGGSYSKDLSHSSLSSCYCGVIDQGLCCLCCVKPISDCCNGNACLSWWREEGGGLQLEPLISA